MNIKIWNQLVLEEQSRIKSVNIRAIIPIKKIGRILGVKGTTSKELSNKYNCGLSFSQYESRGGRLLHIHASSQLMKDIWTEILCLIYDGIPKTSYNRQELGIHFLLCDGLIEVLKESNTFMEIAKISNTKITVKFENMPNSTEHIVKISVRKLDDFHLNCFQTAIHLLAKQFELHPMAALSTPGTKFYDILTQDNETDFFYIPHEYDIVYDYMS